jgi:hypothetical protein
MLEHRILAVFGLFGLCGQLAQARVVITGQDKLWAPSNSLADP